MSGATGKGGGNFFSNHGKTKLSCVHLGGRAPGIFLTPNATSKASDWWWTVRRILWQAVREEVGRNVFHLGAGIGRAREGESVHPGTDSSQRIQR